MDDSDACVMTKSLNNIIPVEAYIEGSTSCVKLIASWNPLGHGRLCTESQQSHTEIDEGNELGDLNFKAGRLELSFAVGPDPCCSVIDD